MCMHCGHHLPPPRPDYYDPGSYFWIYGYRSPAIFRFLGWFFLPTILLTLLSNLLGALVFGYAIAGVALLFLLIPVGVVSAAFVRRCYVPIIAIIAAGVLVHSLAKPEDWRYAVAVCCFLTLGVAALFFLWMVFASELSDMWAWLRRQLHKLRG